MYQYTVNIICKYYYEFEFFLVLIFYKYIIWIAYNKASTFFYWSQ